MDHADLLQKIYEALYRQRFELGVEEFYKTDHQGFSEMRIVFHNGDQPNNTVVITTAPFVQVETQQEENAT